MEPDLIQCATILSTDPWKGIFVQLLAHCCLESFARESLPSGKFFAFSVSASGAVAYKWPSGALT